MKLTIFNAKKTTTKFPSSPYADGTFYFETQEVDSIVDIFDAMVGSFVLDIPLTKNIKTLRRKNNLPFVEKINYIIIDIDDINTRSDRELAIGWFKDSGYRVILGESRTDYRLKGVLRCEPMTPKEAKLVLKEIQKHIPGNVDIGSVGYANYQAPILKHKVLYNGGTKIYPKPANVEIPKNKISVPDSIQQLCINAFMEKGYNFIKKTSTGYICTHPSEVKSPGGFSWCEEFPFNMTHWNPARKDTVWNEVIKTPEYKKYQKERAEKFITELVPKNNYSTNTRYLTNESQKVTEFLDNTDLLKIQSPMGTAKSNVIEEVIHQSRKRNLRILFVTNRISLADDIAAKYTNIKHYLGTQAEDNEYKRGDDLVVQVDSLHKYSTKYFDVVILDEAATTLIHLLKLEKHQKKIATQVFSLSQRKLVLADAFLFDEMVNIFEPKTVTEINNAYRDPVEITFYKHKDTFIKELIQQAEKEPITFSSGSTKILKIVQLMLDQQGITHKTISADTPKEIKEAIFKKFNQKKPLARVVMYSPTLTVGVSNLNEVTTHYHYDSGRSMDVLSSLQMTKRTRSAKKLKIFIQETQNYNPTDLLQIQSQLTDFMEQDDDGDDIGISKAGIKYSKLKRIYNILENRHAFSFKTLMKLQFTENITYCKTRVTPFLYKWSKVVEKKEKQHKLNVFEYYKKMSEEELQDFELKLFKRTKEDQYIKEFTDIKNDETLKNLTNPEIDELTKLEIKEPGSIQALKENLANPDVLLNSRNGSITRKQYKSEYKNLGFKKQGVVYKVNPIMYKLFLTLYEN